MSDKKSSDTTRSESNSTRRLYTKEVRRSTIDRRLKFTTLLFIVSAFLLGLTTLLRVNVENQLRIVSAQLEGARVQNLSLWESIIVLQGENSDLKTSYDALVTLINNEEPMEREVCSTSTFKSWMDYRAITSKSSKQYQLQQLANTDKNYGFRMIDGYHLVAMGSQYGPVGTKYLIQFQDRSVIYAMVGDIKHQGCTSSDGSMIEFIVDSNVLPTSVKRSGNFNTIFIGPIIQIREVE